MDEAFFEFHLPNLLPEGHTLVVAPKMHIASLLYLNAGMASIRTQVQFSSSATLILVPLLQLYPEYCTYEALLSCLFPLSLQQCRSIVHKAQGGERELLLRPLRRTIGSLANGLHQLDLEICSIRNVGYLIKSRVSDDLLC